MATARRRSREVSSGTSTGLRTDAVAYTPACPAVLGFAAVGQFTRSFGRLRRRFAFARFGTASVDFYRTPSRAALTRRPCLVDGGFPPSGPQEDLTATCLTSLFCVHAKHTKGPLAPLGVCAALDPPCALQVVAVKGNGPKWHSTPMSLREEDPYCEGPRFGARQLCFAGGPLFASRSGPILASGEETTRRSPVHRLPRAQGHEFGRR